MSGLLLLMAPRHLLGSHIAKVNDEGGFSCINVARRCIAPAGVSAVSVPQPHFLTHTGLVKKRCPLSS